MSKQVCLSGDHRGRHSEEVRCLRQPDGGCLGEGSHSVVELAGCALGLGTAGHLSEMESEFSNGHAVQLKSCELR